MLNGRIKSPRVLPTITFGQGINFLGIMGLIWTVSSGLGNVVASNASAMAEFRRDIANLQADRTKYVPIIEELQRANAVQDQRMQNIAQSIQDIRTAQAQSFSLISTLKDDVTTIKAVQSHNQQNRPVIQR
jgi:hypothetical protein